MNNLLHILFLILVWLLVLLNQSGYGMVMGTWKYTEYIFVGFSLYYLVHKKRYLPKQILYPTLFLLITFVLVPFISMTKELQGLSYLTSFLVVYVIWQMNFSLNVIHKIGLLYAIFGAGILMIYSFGSTLSGWNDNAIAMIGLFSFLVYFVSFNEYKPNSKHAIIIITILYFFLLWKTNSRSCQLFIILSTILYFNRRKTLKLFSSNKFLFWVLQIPLLISIFVITISHTGIYNKLNDWSWSEFQKTIFNGRDTLWELSYTMLDYSNYLGTFKFNLNFHNSAVAALTVFGVLGYIAWITMFYILLRPFIQWLRDPIVYGSYVAFLIIFLQQSLELGLISPEPNILPYMILGLGLSRIRQLQHNDLNYSTRLQYRKLS